MTSYSLCIPRIFNNIHDKKITSTFENLNLGKIKDIDIIYKIGRDGSTFKMAFVHFESWNYYNSAAVNLRMQIEDPNMVAKIVYDDPWHWILLPNTSNVANESNNTIYSYTQESSSLTTKLNEPTTTLIEERLTNLENELHYVYEELYQREYIPTRYRQNSTRDDEPESGKNSSFVPMTIDELDLGSSSLLEEYMNPCEELHKTPNNTNYVSYTNGNGDDDISLMSSTILGEYECEYEYSYDIDDDNTSKSYLETVNQNHKLWVTANYCGND